MLRNLIALPDGTDLFSGTGTVDAIKSVTLTELVNSGDELTLGSTCANILEATVLTQQETLSLTAGDEVTLYKVDDAGTRRKAGVFVLEKPTKPTANTMKITGYDRVIKLEKDLTAWLKGLTDWPYSLSSFAEMVCDACGLTLASTDIPNADFPVYQFVRETTGRQIMQWIGEACCRFCRANTDGEIELAWYTPAGVSITPSGDHYYFQNGLSYEEYQVETIDAVQLRLADSEDGMPWPSAVDGANSYIITGNPILGAHVTSDLLPVLQSIRNELPTERYTPCKVSIPATLDIHAGNTVQITDKHGATFTAYIMAKTQTNQKDTLECTGSPRRDSATAQNNKSSRQRDAEMRLHADQENAKLNQEELLKRLTNTWTDDGIYLTEDGRLAVNASAILAGALSADLIKGGTLDSNVINGATLKITDGARVANFHVSGGSLYNGIDIGNPNSCGFGAGSALGGSDDWIFWAGNGAFRVTLGGELHTANLIASGGQIAGWTIDDNSIRIGSLGKSDSMWLCSTGTATSANIGNGSGNGWCIGVGSNFGVKRDGSLFASNANISGTINASDGSIGGWKISGNALTSAAGDENGEVSYAVYMMPSQLYYMYNQSAGAGISTSWENVVLAGKAAGRGVSGTFSIGEHNCTFLNGILTEISIDA